mgnify:CR=1 FL=1
MTTAIYSSFLKDNASDTSIDRILITLKWPDKYSLFVLKFLSTLCASYFKYWMSSKYDLEDKTIEVVSLEETLVNN